MDDQAYIVYHQANLGSPCLSFDVMPENDANVDYPLQIYGVAGTQAAKANHNNIIVFKVKVYLHKTGIFSHPAQHDTARCHPTVKNCFPKECCVGWQKITSFYFLPFDTTRQSYFM
jgi:hypothetical protein